MDARHYIEYNQPATKEFPSVEHIIAGDSQQQKLYKCLGPKYWPIFFTFSELALEANKRIYQHPEFLINA
jgi:hypothetical protein